MLPTPASVRERLAPSHAAVGIVLALALALGYAGAHQPKLTAVAVAAGVALFLAAQRPVALAVAAVPLTLVLRRLGLGGSVSVSDVVVATAALLALPAVRSTQELRRARTGLRSPALYLALLLPGLIAHPGGPAVLEWCHRLELTTGATLVGVWLVRENRHRLALRLLVVGCLIVAGSSIEFTLVHALHPAYPLGLHKNFAGAMLSIALLVLMAGNQLHEIPKRIRHPVEVIIALGLLATQSRGAMLALAFGIVAWLVRSGRTSRVGGGTRVLAVAIAIGVLGFAGYSVNQQVNDKLNSQTNSAGVRQRVETYTRTVVWRSSPITGAGLRYYNTGEFGPLAQAPNNVVDNELAESGDIGLAGFVLFQSGLMYALWRRGGVATLGLAVVLAHLLHGMFDIYWGAGTVSLTFVIVGMSLATNKSSGVSEA